MKTKTRFDRGVDVAFRWMMIAVAVCVVIAVLYLLKQQTHVP
jgi:hypothetical protein